MRVVVAQRAPQPRGLHEQLEPHLALEVLVAGGPRVATGGVGHRRVHVEGGRARRPVARALLAADRAPRERRPGAVDHPRPLLREVQHRLAPAQRVGGRLGGRVGEGRQDERLHVPERVPVVSRAGQALGADGAALGAGPGLERVEQRHADRLLQRGVPLQLHVGAAPESVEVGALALGEPLPAGPLRRGECGVRLVAKGRPGALARPAVGEELLKTHHLPRLELGRDRDPREVVLALGLRLRPLGAIDHVVHAGGHAQLARPRAVDEPGAPLAVTTVLLRHERAFQRGCCARVVRLRRHRLVRHQLRLEHDAGGGVHRLDLVGDRRHRAVHERHQPRGANVDLAASGRAPVHLPAQHAVAQIQHALVAQQVAVADVERLIVHEQADHLAVGHVHQRLAGVWQAVGSLGVGQRAHLVEGVQVGPGHVEGLALVEVAAQADVAVRQGEDGLALPEVVEPQLPLAHGPGLDVVEVVAQRSISSLRSSTTMSAPRSARASL